jgi:hypothetical protein
MSIDRRLREAFRASGEDPLGGIDVERHLQAAVARARPREIARLVALVTAALALAAGIFAAGIQYSNARNAQPLDGGPPGAVSPVAAIPAPGTPLDGIYSTTIRRADGRDAGLSRADAYGISGAMQVWFDRDTVRVEQELEGLGLVPARGTIEVSGHRLVVHDEGETIALDWERLRDGDLRFTLVDETRTGVERLIDEVLWTSHPWTLVSK